MFVTICELVLVIYCVDPFDRAVLETVAVEVFIVVFFIDVDVKNWFL